MLIKKVKADISFFKITESKIIVVDQQNRVYLFDGNFNLKSGFKIKLPPNRTDENSVKCDENARFLLLSSPSAPLTLWDIEQRKLLGKFAFHRGDVLSVSFSQDGYFASGGIDGNILLYSLEIKKMVSKLARHRDFITDITFDGDKVVAGTYDKGVLFVDQSSLQKKFRSLHLKKTCKVEKKEFLTSASQIAEIIKWDSETCDFTDKFSAYGEFSDFFIYEGYVFILLKNRVVLYDLKNEVLINEMFISNGGDKIQVSKNHVYIAKSNEIYKYPLYDELAFLNAIVDQDYKKAYDMVRENPFLKRTKAYEKLEQIYLSTVKKALKFYEHSLKSEAVELLKPFMNVLEKKEEISKIISHYENIIKFKKAFESRNYALFYQIAQMFDLLKNTKYFKIVEKEWEIKFEKAKELVLNGKITLAREVLKDFIPVSEKYPLINTLFKQAQIFSLLREKIAKKDFKGFFAIIKQNPELKDSKEYKEVMEYAKNLYEKALKALEDEDFATVLKSAEILEDIEGYEIKAQELINRAKISLEFLKCFNTDKNRAFSLVEEYPFLKKLKVYRLYEQVWREKLKHAEKIAFEGKLKSALEYLNEYKDIKTKAPRIKSMLKSAYIQKKMK